MRKVFILLVCFPLCTSAFSQVTKKRDTIPYTVPSKRVDDFSQRKEVNRDVLYYSNLYQKKTTVVIIDKKIYSIDSKEFTSLTKDRILDIRVVNDETATTPIKTVIWVVTSKK